MPRTDNGLPWGDHRKVEDFRYLGSDLAADGTVDQAVEARINAAWIKWRESTGILCDQRCSKTLKGKVYRAVVRPAMPYESECWPITMIHKRQLHAAKIRMSRWACRWRRLDKVRNEDVSDHTAAPIKLKLSPADEETSGPPHKKSTGARSASEASTWSPKEEVEGRYQGRPHRSEGYGGICLG
ncbi:hypothetical protein GCK32_022107 [Trichostrongylus colubriformis]|uniref:Uncharacterized protein n=1 Tax=Trichostrongylus colubriformis TaxID=6319 RepID=A0AAN8F5H2_TRICO